MSFTNWRHHFPYQEPRQIQAEALQALVDNWSEYDVFVLVAPTAFGKTAVARTLMNALYSASVITPTNLLVHQFLDEFPDTPTLHRMDSYYCEKWKRPCPITRAKLLQFCSQKRDDHACKCSSDLATAKYRKGPGIYNYHTYLAHKLYRPTVIIDEAHNLIPVIRDRLALRLWQHDYKYPSNMWNMEQMQQWIGTLSNKKQATQKIRLLKEAVSYKCPQYVVQRTQEPFNGKGTARGKAELRDCLKLLPVDISTAPPMMWPREVEKLVLMSATIGEKDIEALGLGGKRVIYIDCKSPISEGNRPIVALNSVAVNRQSMAAAIPIIANEINEIANHHTGEKGVIHVTYQMARDLQNHLTSPRFMFHDRTTKSDVYKSFREGADDRVLIACGMYEGIDLPEDLGRWQVIAKLPWPSLASPAISHLAKLDPDWYTWETLKTFIQACGRVCRTPEDFGVTYVLDRSLTRLIAQGRHLIPQWFYETLQYNDIITKSIEEDK